MKPRPHSLLLGSIHQRSISNQPCRRQFHVQRPVLISSLYCLQLHDRSQQITTTLEISSFLRSQFLRHASTATATAAKSSPPPATHSSPSKQKHKFTASTKLPSSQRTLPPSEKLNPPPSSYAPELSVPEQKPGQGKLRWLLNAGRAYIAFYKGGIANVRSTAKLAKAIRAKAKSTQDAKPEDILTRAEWQIMRRSRKDLFRLPVFAAMVLIFGEWLPLFALYITPVIPEPCRIPSQTKRGLGKLEKRRRERERRLGIDAARLVFGSRKPGVPQSVGAVPQPNSVEPEDVTKMDVFALLTLSTKLDAHSKLWDWAFMTPPTAILRRGVRRKLEYIGKDDRLIQRDGGWQGLGKQEGERACVERGINVLGRSEKDLIRDLAEWFAKR